MELSKPSLSLARRLMSDLGWDDRLVGECYNQMAGNSPSFLYSLEEAASFLDGDADRLTDRRNGSVCTINPSALMAWTKTALGDEELAAAIAATIEPLTACQDPVQRQHEEIALIQPLKELLLARVAQCRQALEGSAAVEDGL